MGYLLISIAIIILLLSIFFLAVAIYKTYKKKFPTKLRWVISTLAIASAGVLALGGYFSLLTPKTLPEIVEAVFGKTELTSEVSSAEHKMATEEKMYRLLGGLPFILSSEWVYYIQDVVLYKMNISTEQRTSINNDSSEVLLVADDWIYFIGNDNKFYRVRTDGTDKTSLLGREVLSATLFDGTIYFLASKHDTTMSSLYLHTIRTDGTDEKCISDTEMTEYKIADGWIYFVDNKNELVSKMKLDGSLEDGIYKGKAEKLTVVDKKVFFIKTDFPKGLYQMSIHGDEVKNLYECGVIDDLSNFVVDQNTIYFATLDGKNRGVNKLNLDGYGEITNIFDKSDGEILELIGDWIYFRDIGCFYKIKTDGKEVEELFHTLTNGFRRVFRYQSLY